MFDHEIGGYRLEAELGRGGMGVVYEAEELALKRPVALKLLAPHLLEDKTARARFQEEIKTSVAIEHPHVVPIYNAGYDNGHFFLAMRLVRGPDLWRVIQNGGPLPEVRALRIVGQIASALNAVHELGIVHRDIKPQNVLMWHAGHPDEHAFLTDFGIAKALDDTLGITWGAAIGTRGYMAPELFLGKPATPGCDQFSLACLTYELLSGHLPYSEQSGATEEMLPVPIGLYAPAVSKRVRELIERALSPNPRNRFADVRAFVMADATVQDAFEQSSEITDTIRRVRSDSELVSELYTEHRLSIERIAEISDLQKSEVVRLRRRAARQAIVGELPPDGR